MNCDWRSPVAFFIMNPDCRYALVFTGLIAGSLDSERAIKMGESKCHGYGDYVPGLWHSPEGNERSYRRSDPMNGGMEGTLWREAKLAMIHPNDYYHLFTFSTKYHFQPVDNLPRDIEIQCRPCIPFSRALYWTIPPPRRTNE